MNLKLLDFHGKLGKSVKYIVLVRHGEITNPRRVVYNRDDLMKREEDIPHLSEMGKRQMRALGYVLKAWGVVKIFRYSPQERARESADHLNWVLNIDDVKPDPCLDDNYAPGAVGMPLEEYEQIQQEAFDPMWKWYGHETMGEILKRMRVGFFKVAQILEIGEVGILISHGHPLAILIGSLLGLPLSAPEQLRKADYYPPKGSAKVFALDENNQIVGDFLVSSPGLEVGTVF